jgi:excisionase family DNA binding protein
LTPERTDPEMLGKPLSITEVAQLLGCSTWTVRQQHIRHGLPHFRSSPNGRLVFFREQVVRWVLEQQEKESSR